MGETPSKVRVQGSGTSTECSTAREEAHVHPSHRMWVNARGGLDRAPHDIRILPGVFEQGTQVADDLEAHTFLVAAGQCWGCKSLGDEVGGPTAQLDIGVRRGEGQDANHDLRVVGLWVAEDGLLGLVQLLELLAHGLHIGGLHGGQQEAGTWVAEDEDGLEGRRVEKEGQCLPSFYSTKWVGVVVSGRGKAPAGR